VIGGPNSTGKEMRLFVRRKVTGLCRIVKSFRFGLKIPLTKLAERGIRTPAMVRNFRRTDRIYSGSTY